MAIRTSFKPSRIWSTKAKSPLEALHKCSKLLWVDLYLLVAYFKGPRYTVNISDTGSDVFWLPQVGCTSSGPDVYSCPTGQGLYNPSLSTTAVDLHSRFQIQYGTGSALGNYIADQMSFGDANGNHVVVGNVTLGA